MSDPDSATYREMTTADAVSDAEITAMIRSGELIQSTDDDPLRSPEQWTETGWDEAPDPDYGRGA